MRRKRILMLIKGLDRGGAEQLLVTAAPYGDATRFEYEVAYVLPERNALVPELEHAGIPVHCLGGGRAWVPSLRRLVRNRDIDLVHSHSPLPGAGARLGLPHRRLRLVATEHNLWERYHPATYWANLLTFPRNDHVFGVSDCVLRSIRYPAPLKHLPMPPVETLYHGLDPRAAAPLEPAAAVRADLGIPDGVPVVGTVGNFKTAKGYPYLMQAAAAVRRASPEARFVIVGMGVEEALRPQVEELGLAGTVVFAGYRSDVSRVMSTFDVFVMASLFEGLSIALLEAMSLGIPPVVTGVGGTPEVVDHGTHGLVVPARDPEALAGALIEVLGDEDLRQRLGQAGRERAAWFDIRKTVNRMEAVYQELLA